MMVLKPPCYNIFFFNDTATTEIYTLSLHDALPISRLLAQDNQHVELLVVKLCSAAHAGLGDLAQPFLTMARMVDTLAGAGNAPAAIDRLDPVHDPRDRKSTRLNSSHGYISYAVLCLTK